MQGALHTWQRAQRWAKISAMPSKGIAPPFFKTKSRKALHRQRFFALQDLAIAA